MRKSIITMLLASLAFLPLAGRAEGPGYSYLDAGYVVTNIDEFDEDADGFLLRGSFEFVENWFLYGRYLDQSVEAFGTDVDVTEYDLGVGYAWPLNDAMDLYGKAGYVAVEAEALGEDVDDDGYELSAGLRGRAMNNLELEGVVTYVDLSDSGDDTSFGLAARWYFLEQLAVGVEGDFSDDAKSYGIGVRWAFGQ